MKNIADIASVSYRAYKGCRWVKRKLVAHINSHRKRQDGLSRMHMKPWPAGANVTRASVTRVNVTRANATNAHTAAEANTTDAPRSTADEERKSIQVNVVDHLFLAGLDLSTIDPKARELLNNRDIVPDTATRDKVNKEKSGTTTLDEKKLGKPGTQAEALFSHPPFAIRRLDATLADDLLKLAMRANQAHASRCAV